MTDMDEVFWSEELAQELKEYFAKRRSIVDERTNAPRTPIICDHEFEEYVGLTARKMFCKHCDEEEI